MSKRYIEALGTLLPYRTYVEDKSHSYWQVSLVILELLFLKNAFGFSGINKIGRKLGKFGSNLYMLSLFIPNPLCPRYPDIFNIITLKINSALYFRLTYV